MPSVIPVANAKTLDFKAPGAGAANYGWIASNVGAGLTKLYGKRGEKKGGSKVIWNAIQKNTEASMRRNPKSAITNQFQKFLDTGKHPDGASDRYWAYAVGMLDFGLRESARNQQHKKSFLNSFLGKIVVIALQIVATVVTMNPYTAVAIGAAVGAMNGGGVLGAALGGISGYGIGKGTLWLQQGGLSSAVGALTRPAAGAGVTVGGNAAANVANNIFTGVRTGAALGGVRALGGLATGIVSNLDRVAGPIIKPRDGTIDPAGGRGVTPSLAAQVIDPAKIAQASADKQRIESSRLARTNSWVLEQRGRRGITGELPNTQPTARSGASVIPVADERSGRRPVVRRTGSIFPVADNTPSGRPSERRPVVRKSVGTAVASSGPSVRYRESPRRAVAA